LKIDNKIDLDYFLAHKNLFNFKYVFLLHTMKSGKSLQLMKEFMCWQIWSHSDEKNLGRRTILLQNANKVKHYYHRSTIIWFHPFKLWCPANAVYFTTSSLSHGCLPLGTRSGLTSAELRICKPLWNVLWSMIFRRYFLFL